ncbi:MAG: NADH-quinone oxidoreductase subunit NuoH [Deltaproteobacteria bacterium]|nr:NADH-quinone oxidoreductase subunit NuoH [Candidatus Anaeroferrophillus wilburensis]MBN2889981.1 NADH-quinone oxidoreductase subunit NuoH [Deltaproteobacteria bacterium]
METAGNPIVLRMVIAVVLVIAFVFLNAMVMGYLERKISARIQRRPGLYEVGPYGILQLLIDGLKLIGKQLLIPMEADRFLFRLAPLLSFVPVVLPLMVIPFSPKLQARDFDIGLVFILAISSLNVMAILMAGWGSNNKYSLFGAMRSVAQNISYEIPMLLSLLAVILMTNTFSMQGIVAAQNKIWFFLVQPVAFLIYIIAAFAETNRAPFDLPEAESELTAGYHTEYSGMGFSLFMLAEYANMFVVCSIATTLFFGGWHGIPLPFGEYSSAIWFFIKAYGLMIFMVWVRWTYPRTRFDQLMNFCWKYLIPFALVNLLVTAVLVKLL